MGYGLQTESGVNPDPIPILRDSLLFGQLSGSQIGRIASRLRWYRLREGEWLFKQGQPAERFFLVVSGQMKLFYLSTDGNEKVMEVLHTGDTFAEALMFLDQPCYPVSAAALRDSALLGIDAVDFLRMLRDSRDTCLVLLGELSRRMHALVREIEDLTLQSATSRVAGYLMRKAPASHDRFRLEFPKGVLASRLSVKPETFSRILRNLSEQGIVSVRGQQVEIHDRAALACKADLCSGHDADSAFQRART